MIESFLERNQIPASAKKLQGVFDFRKMPMNRTSKELTMELLISHGNEEADWILTNLFPELDSIAFKSEALAARIFLFENQEDFFVLKDPAKPQNGRHMDLAVIFKRRNLKLAP